MLATTVELFGVNALNFALGAYLPLSTTIPIFVGGVIRKFVEIKQGLGNDNKEGGEPSGDDDLGPGSLFATGLVAGGALAGVIVALLSIPPEVYHFLKSVSCEQVLTSAIGSTGYQLLGVGFILVMGITLFRIACKKV